MSTNDLYTILELASKCSTLDEFIASILAIIERKKKEQPLTLPNRSDRS